METILRMEIDAFTLRQRDHAKQARERVALQLLAGLDPARIDATPYESAVLAARLHRLIERERQRGVRGHWAYDLNRHIALKQALDRLRARTRAQEKSSA